MVFQNLLGEGRDQSIMLYELLLKSNYGGCIVSSAVPTGEATRCTMQTIPDARPELK